MDRITVISSTGERGTIPRDQLNEALAAGYRVADEPPKTTFAAESTRVTKPVDTGRAHVVNIQTGEKGTIPQSNVAEAIQSGYRVESPAELAVRRYVEENKGVGGAAKVFAKQAFDEAFMGVPDLLGDLQEDPITVQKRKELYEAHPIANALGGVAGAGASLLYGGGVVSPVAKKTAEKLIAGRLLQAGAAYTKSRTGAMIARDVAKTAVQTGLEGAAYATPQAITYAALGKPEEAAEKLAYGTLGGALLGGVMGGAKAPVRLAEYVQGRGVKKLSGIVDEQFTANPSLWNAPVEKAMMEKYGLNIPKNLFVDDPQVLRDYAMKNMSRDEFAAYLSEMTNAQNLLNDMLTAANNPKNVNAELVNRISGFINDSPEFQTQIANAVANSKTRKELFNKLANEVGQMGRLGSFVGVLNASPETVALSVAAALAKNTIARVGERITNPLTQLQFGTSVLNRIAKTQQALSVVPLMTTPSKTARALESTNRPFTPTEYDEMVTKLNELTPEQITQVFADFPVDPDTKERAVDRMAKIVEYARANIPEISPPDPFSKAPRVPSDQQLYKFGRTMRLMMDPAEFKRRLETNTLTAQDINDMRVMYPELLRQFQLMMMNEYMNTPVKLPYSVRMKLNMVMGNSPTMQNIQQYQQQFAPKEEGTGSNVNIDPSRMAPPTDTLQQRR